MTSNADITGIVEFASFRLDRKRRLLTRLDGTAVTMSSRAFETLLLLASRPGEIFSKQELVRAIWPNVVVEDNNLTQAVSVLRKALGDNQDPPQIIQTVSGRGYCFIATPRPVSDVAVLQRSPRNGLLYASVAVAVVLMLAASVLLRNPDVGPQTNNIAPATTTAAMNTPTRVMTAARSIAVLPFSNLESDARGSSFVLGLHEELLTQLSKVSGLQVLSRNAVLRYREDERAASDIARELNASSVLEGSVRVSGTDLRISMQLFDAASQLNLWAQTYDVSLDDLQDLFAMQADIANQVAAALAVQLLPEERQRTSQAPTEFPLAYQHYLAAVSAISANDFAAAVQHLEETVAIDPDFTEAWFRLATNHNVLTATPLTTPLQHHQRALLAARKAVELDPDSVNAHSVMGAVMYSEWQWEEAREEFAKAEELANSSNSIADNQFRADEVMLLLALGEFEEARRKEEILLTVNPIHLVGLSFLMLTHEYAGDHSRAMQQYAKGEAMLPTWWGDNPALWIALGRRDTAHLAAAERDFADYVLRNVLVLHDDAVAAVAELSRMRKVMETLSPAQQLNAAMFSAYFSQPDMAMDFLETGLRNNGASFYMIWLPVFGELRQTSRFKAMMQMAGVVDYWRAHGWPAACAPEGDSFTCR